MKYSVAFIAMLLIVLAAYSAAGVNRKTGNFYISYSEFSLPGPLKIVRTYNSKSTYKGLFGFGWNSKFESYISIGPDGNPILHSMGAIRMKFQSVDPVPQAGAVLASSLAAVEQALIQERMVAGSPEEREQIQAKVQEELKKANSQVTNWERLVAEGKIQPPDIAVGAEFKYDCGCSFRRTRLMRTADGYRHETPDAVEIFDNDGKLKAIVGNDQTVTLQRIQGGSQNGLVQQVSDGSNSIGFTYDDAGRVVGLVHNQSGRQAKFEYEGAGLTVASDSEGNTYRYAYDGKYNLTRIDYDDGRTYSVKYEPTTLFVSETVDKDGSVARYRYGYLDELKNDYFTEVSQYPPPGQTGPVRRERVEYYKERLDGEVIEKVIAKADGVTREFIHDKSRILKKIKESSLFTPFESTTYFEFDSAGRVTSVNSGQWRRRYTYADSASNRVKGVKLDYGVEDSNYQFTYDKKNRISSSHHNGAYTKVDYVEYDSDLIGTIERRSEKLTILRDEKNRVVGVELDDGVKVSVLSIRYTNSGEAQLVVENPREAVHLTGALLGMLRNIAPAGERDLL